MLLLPRKLVPTYLFVGDGAQHAAASDEYHIGQLVGNVGRMPDETTPIMICILLMPGNADRPVHNSYTAHNTIDYVDIG